MDDIQLSAVTRPMPVSSSWWYNEHVYAKLLPDMPALLAACMLSLFQVTAMRYQHQQQRHCPSCCRTSIMSGVRLAGVERLSPSLRTHNSGQSMGTPHS